jgi:purine-cytosine permease-like protein
VSSATPILPERLGGGIAGEIETTGILQHVQTFLDDIGDLIAPFAFVLLADWLWGLRDRDDVDSCFRRPRGFGAAQWNWPAIRTGAGDGFAQLRSSGSRRSKRP